MVISAGELAVIHILAYSLRCGKVKRSTLYACYFSCRDKHRAYGGVFIGKYLCDMIPYISCVGSVQIEIRMVCEIHHRVLVAYRIIAYLNRIGCQSVLNIKRQRSWEALLAVNARVGEHYIGIVVFAVILDVPYLLIEADITAVKRVAVVVFGKSIFLAVKGELSAADTVCISSD